MCLQFDNEMAAQADDLLKSARWFERAQREQEINQRVPPCQDVVHALPIDAVPETFFARRKREVAPYERSRWQQATKKHIRAEMHMVMTVHTRRVGSVQTAKFVQLRRHDVCEGPGQSWMKHALGETVAPQVSRELPLAFNELGRASPC
jgi:hypothetical protein